MLTRLAVVASALVVSSAPAVAGEPNHIRIVWNVQASPTVPAGLACARRQPLSERFTLAIPAAWPCKTDPPAAGWMHVTPDLVKPGDFVTVYAINYNAVSYKPATAVVTTLKPEEPVAIQLLIAVLQLAGFKAPSAAPGFDFPRPSTGSACQRATNIDDCLRAMAAAVGVVAESIDHWDTDLKARATALGVTRAQIPSSHQDKPLPPPETDFDIPDLDATACAFSVIDGKNPLGKSCKQSAGWLENVGEALGTGYALVREFDSAAWPAVSDEQSRRRDRYKAALDGWLDYVTASRTGVRSELAIGATKLAEDLAAIKAYRTALDPAKAAAFAAEMPRQGPVASLNRLVFALPLRFVGDPEGAPPKVSQTFELEVAAKQPLFMASAGIMVQDPGQLAFQKLAVEQEPNGSGGLQRRLVLQDSSDYRWVTALAATHFRVPLGCCLYATIGTTADRNIFKSVVIGPSWYFPKLRSVLTVAGLGAKGTKEKDLQGILDTYPGSNGIVDNGINVAQVPVRERWYWNMTVGWTFTPF